MRFKRHFRVERLAPDLVFLLSEQEKHTLSGAIYYELAPYLQGHLTAEDIAAQVQALYPSAQVHYTLRRLRQQEFLADDDLPDSPHAALADALNYVSIQPPVKVLTLGRIDPLMIQGVVESHSNPQLDLVITDDVLHPDFAAHNAQAVRPWLLLKINGPLLWIGPLFLPGKSACGLCLTQRVRLNQPVETFLNTQLDTDMTPPLAVSQAALNVGIGLALLEIWAWASGSLRLVNRLMTYDLRTHDTRWHTLVKRPQCPACGSDSAQAFEAPILQSRPKLALTEAGHRSQQAAVLYEQYAHHVSPITGIVPYLARVDAPAPLFVYASGYNRARSFKHWQNFRRNLRSQSAGKGTDDIQARVSALCEALERYSGLAQGDEQQVQAAYQDMQEAVHPSRLLLYSERQYEQRQDWNATCPPHLYVPQRFDDTQPLAWTPAWSLTTQRMTYVPMAYAYYDVPLPETHDFCSADSNGCAAGSSLEDAILQGLFELIERDSIALWWDNRARRPALDLTTLTHPYIAQMQESLTALNREVWLLDITSDLMIPAFVCVSRVVGRETEDLVLGFGAHFDVQVAALRAMTEMCQSLPAALRDTSGRTQSQSPWETAWWQTVTLETDAYLAPDLQQTIKSAHDYGSLAQDDLQADVETCTALLRRKGLDLLVINQTRPDVGLPVVRVMVPGLRHFWARYAPGRLYDVPVQLGWLPAPRREDEMNPRAMFM